MSETWFVLFQCYGDYALYKIRVLYVKLCGIPYARTNLSRIRTHLTDRISISSHPCSHYQLTPPLRFAQPQLREKLPRDPTSYIISMQKIQFGKTELGTAIRPLQNFTISSDRLSQRLIDRLPQKSNPDPPRATFISSTQTIAAKPISQSSKNTLVSKLHKSILFSKISHQSWPPYD